MPRANRFHVPNVVWHITQRCHDRKYLLRFERDRARWRYWLFQARRRYGLRVFNYIVTSNHIHLLVQGTSATLEGNPDAEAFALSLPMDALADGCVVTDLVYKPRVTSVMMRAQALGHRVVDGSGMLLHQGALAFERWTGSAAPLDVMAEALAR